MAASYYYVFNVPLNNHVPSAPTEPLFLEKLIAVTCQKLDIDSAILYHKNKTSRIKYGRWIVWEIITATKGFRSTDCAMIFGNYDHSTVVHGLNTLPMDLKHNDLLNAIYKDILLHMEIKMESIEKFRAFREKNKKDRESRLPKIHA